MISKPFYSGLLVRLAAWTDTQLPEPFFGSFSLTKTRLARFRSRPLSNWTSEEEPSVLHAEQHQPAEGIRL